MEALHMAGTFPDSYAVHSFADVRAFNAPIRYIGALDFVSHVHKMWGMYDYVNKVKDFPSSINAVITRIRFLGRSITDAFDDIAEFLNMDAISMLHMASLPGYATVRPRERFIKMYKIFCESYLSSLTSHSGFIKYRPDNYGTTNNIMFGAMSTQYNQRNVVSMRRKPVWSRWYYSTPDLDTSWTMKKAPTPYTVNRTVAGPFVTGNQLEILTARIQPGKWDESKSTRQLMSTQYVQGTPGLNDRVTLGMILTNNSGTQYADYLVRIRNPSESAAVVLELSLFFGPSYDSIISMTDVPVMEVPPSWYLYWNQATHLAFNQTSIYYAFWSRMNRTDYFMKICPDENTWAEDQVGDGEVIGEAFENGLFGVDF